jgi:hypothetical protein
MQNVLKEMDKIELVNIERLAHILKGLSTVSNPPALRVDCLLFLSSLI